LALPVLYASVEFKDKPQFELCSTCEMGNKEINKLADKQFKGALKKRRRIENVKCTVPRAVASNIGV